MERDREEDERVESFCEQYIEPCSWSFRIVASHFGSNCSHREYWLNAECCCWLAAAAAAQPNPLLHHATCHPLAATVLSRTVLSDSPVHRLLLVAFDPCFSLSSLLRPASPALTLFTSITHPYRSIRFVCNRSSSRLLLTRHGVLEVLRCVLWYLLHLRHLLPGTSSHAHKPTM